MAYQRSGSGAPLVLVHGTGGFSTRWKPILPAFEKYFTVYAVDRRGRGESGDGSNYAIEREFDDVAAGGGSNYAANARRQGSPSPGPTILSPSPSRDILFQNAFDLSDRFWIRH
jgi:pimeloyl-ACP methyl ester carboxylesterase